MPTVHPSLWPPGQKLGEESETRALGTNSEEGANTLPLKKIQRGRQGSEVPTHVAPWMDSESTMLREGTRQRKPHGVRFHVCDTPRTGSSMDGKGSEVGARGWGC